ncbi:MAG: GatB/YqeY domain-containing protein [Deltaproteobacteria bacterium]|nr:GatB/YqeY domain-containing protein [Deltaproteobacteria bacterium]MBW2304115.1 GatB/YqeY domain-containing protein [Deltaproteobacteria bacterium]
MGLHEEITKDLKKAIKAKEELRISCLRMLKTALKNRQVELGRELTDTEIQTVISSLVRKGREAAEGFRKGGREDLAAKEEEEIQILHGYLPEQLDPGEIEKVVGEIIAELGATGPKDMGKVMKAAMARMTGKAQGKEVSEIAKRLLSTTP